MHRAVIVIIVVVLVLLGAGVAVGMLISGADHPQSTAPAAAAAPTPTPTRTPAPTPTRAAPGPTATATATRTVQVPVPGPTVYVPSPVPQPYPAYPPYYGSAVWMWAPPVSPIPYGIHIHVHSAANLNSANLAEVYEGTTVGIVCSVVSQNVSSYGGSSSNWDYVTYPAAGWVADVFLDTRSAGDPNGAVAPRC